MPHPRPRPLRLPLGIALLLAAASGVLMVSAYPAVGWWPLGWIAPIGLLLALQGRRPRSGLLIGFVWGEAFFLPFIEWSKEFLRIPGADWIPWVALSTAMALWCMAQGLLTAVAYRWIPRAWPGPGGRLVALPLAVAGIWTAREAVANAWPWGGFAWGRVGLSQADGPFAPLYSWIGISGLTFAIVWAGAFLLALLAERRRLGYVAALTIGFYAASLVPVFPTQVDGTMRVAAVQGNAKAGYFDQRDYGDNLRDQVDATIPVLGTHPDVIVWPEGGSDVDPMLDPGGRDVFNQLVADSGAPLVAGVITTRDVDGTEEYFNTSEVWDDDAVQDYYDKKHPVPFGEYVPERAFFRALAPELIDLIGREYTPGTTDQVLDVRGVLVGAAICFDIVDDQLARDMVNEGASAVFAQTNDADFGYSDESVQQLAIARARAIELGRTVVNISTVGTSAVIGADGRTIDSLPWHTPGAMVDDIPLRSGTTAAVLLERGLELGASAFGLLALVAARIAGRRRR